MVCISFSAVAFGGKFAGEKKLNGHKKVPSIRMNPAAEQKAVHAAIRLRIPADKWHEALMILNSVIEPIRLEDGCISCRLYQDLEEEGVLMLEQIWSSQNEMERHLRGDKFHTVLLVVEMAAESPEIRFDVIEQTTGMETIQRIRE
jgi:quinol monooxygenase YgiN